MREGGEEGGEGGEDGGEDGGEGGRGTLTTSQHGHLSCSLDEPGLSP